MMHRAAPFDLRRLFVHVDEAVPKRQTRIAHSGSLLVPHYLRTEHQTEKLQRGCQIGREDVYVIETYAHKRLLHFRWLFRNGAIACLVR